MNFLRTRVDVFFAGVARANIPTVSGGWEPGSFCCQNLRHELIGDCTKSKVVKRRPRDVGKVLYLIYYRLARWGPIFLAGRTYHVLLCVDKFAPPPIGLRRLYGTHSEELWPEMSKCFVRPSFSRSDFRLGRYGIITANPLLKNAGLFLKSLSFPQIGILILYQLIEFEWQIRLEKHELESD